MKLNIDLSTVSGWDDESIATVIKQAVDEEINRFVRALVKESLKEQEKAARAAIQAAAKRDWRKVAAAVERLQEDA